MLTARRKDGSLLVGGVQYTHQDGTCDWFTEAGRWCSTFRPEAAA